jgi:multicomponent Na+:H+ antiporter subunit G
MERPLMVLGILLSSLGLVFMFFGSVGLVRLPDFFSRTHATSKVDTVGSALLLLGIAMLEGFTLNSGKLMVAMVFVVLTNPVAAHALARAAVQSGEKPWRRNDPQRPEQAAD